MKELSEAETLVIAEDVGDERQDGPDNDHQLQILAEETVEMVFEMAEENIGCLRN